LWHAAGVAVAALEVTAAEIHVANDGFDGRASTQFALVGAEGEVRVAASWPRYPFVDTGALDRAAVELLGGIGDDSERVTYGLPGSALAWSNELAAPGRGHWW